MSVGTRLRATMRKWFSDKGFGFATIERASTEGQRRTVSRDEDVFVHVRSLCFHLRDDHSKVDVGAATTQVAVAQGIWPDVYVETEPGDKGPRARSAVCAWCEAEPDRGDF